MAALGRVSFFLLKGAGEPSDSGVLGLVGGEWWYWKEPSSNSAGGLREESTGLAERDSTHFFHFSMTKVLVCRLVNATVYAQAAEATISRKTIARSKGDPSGRKSEPKCLSILALKEEFPIRCLSYSSMWVGSSSREAGVSKGRQSQAEISGTVWT